MLPTLSSDPARFAASLEDLRSARSVAQEVFEGWWQGRDPEYFDEGNISWQIEKAFLKLLVVAEALGLEALRDIVLKDMTEAKASKKGFWESKAGPDEPYSVWLGRFSQHLAALEVLGPSKQEHQITKELTDILRATLYPITDQDLFSAAPESEDDVHRRIEGVLKCVFPALKREPTLTKPIKNFKPDTGLPSLKTLIEYKFISHKSQVPTIADQLLADTRGYVDKDWNTFIYVIYETGRFAPENEWNQLLKDSGVAPSTSLIVLHGEPLKRPAGRSRGAQAKKSTGKKTAKSKRKTAS